MSDDDASDISGNGVRFAPGQVAPTHAEQGLELMRLFQQIRVSSHKARSRWHSDMRSSTGLRLN